MSNSAKNVLNSFLIWRSKHISDKYFQFILCIIVGILAGLAAVVIKNSVHFISYYLKSGFFNNLSNYLFLAYPIAGILIVVLVIKFIFKNYPKSEIPNVLYAISKLNAKLAPSNIYKTIFASSVTVGFGGSVGLEGPSVTTGASVGSSLGQLLRLNYRQTVLLIGCAGAAAIASLFKAPITGVVFSLEVFLLDLTMSSILPLLISSAIGALTSYLFFGQDVIYDFKLISKFNIKEIPYYLMLGVITGLFALYFTNVQIIVKNIFKKINSWVIKLVYGGIILGVLIFFMPSLFGEGYQSVNSCLNGNYSFLFEHSLFYNYKDNIYSVILMFVAIVLFKSIATAVTFGAGGVGGIFAPILFLGANLGFLFSKVLSVLGFSSTASNFALVGMAGLLSGVMYAPLTAIFLIAEITNGYELIFPLMLVSTISFAINRSINQHSIYNRVLAKKGNLITHNKENSVLSMMKVEKLIEKNFITVHPEDTLRDLTRIISKSTRNIYPVVDSDNNFKGIVFLDHIKHLIFNVDLYDKIYVKDLSFNPQVTVSINESMRDVMKKFHITGNYNIPIVENGKYIGFISRANVYSEYQKMLKYYSID